MTRFYLALVFFVWEYYEVAAVSSYYKESSKNIFADESSLIPLFKFGKKSYYVGTLEKLTYLQAHQFCKDIRMNLATVHSTEELNALEDYVQKISKETDFWSSGSRLLDGKNWIWMSNLEIVEYTNWKPGEPNNKHNNEKCISFMVNKKKLLFNDDNCDRKLPFICEKDRSHPQEVDWTDSKQSSLFQSPYVLPNINLLHHKGKSYYIGNLFEATFLEAIQYCQLIHMHLVSIDSKEENDILHKYIRNTLAGRLFWSSGSRVIDDKTWIWMSSGDKVEYTAWAYNQPDNSGKKERCIQLVHEKNDGLFWNDLSCDTKVNFICESYGNYSYYGSEVAIPPPEPSDRENVCRIEAAAHYQEGPLLQGTVVDGITYRFSKIKADHIKASRICRQHQMELISIPNEKRSSAITKLISQIGADGKFWTSGEKQSDGEWIWWNLQPLTYTNWAPKEPDGKEEFCIQLNDDGKWRDQHCDVERYFICEGSNSTRSDFFKCGLQPIVNMLID